MLILPIHYQSIYFHLFVSSSISLTSVLYFSEYRSFNLLVGFIPRQFILVGEIVNGLFPNFSFWQLVDFVQKHNRFLYIKFLSCKLTEFIDEFNQFLVMSLGFSMYRIMSSANSDCLFLLQQTNSFNERQELSPLFLPPHCIGPGCIDLRL